MGVLTSWSARAKQVLEGPPQSGSEQAPDPIEARAAAWALDVLVMIALAMITMQVVSNLAVVGGLGVAFGLIAIFVIQWWYFALAEYFWAGRTVGKRLVGLRVVDERGLRI